MYNYLKKTIIPTLLSLIGTIIALFPNNPINLTLPSRDSGVFLYVGWRLLNGDVPYRDVWDHKPPLIYIVDAFGIILSPKTLWGVWLLQFLFLFFTLFFLYKALDESLGTLSAVIGVIVLTSGLLTILDQGNVTEEYALLFQALCFWLSGKAIKYNYPLKAIFWIGLCGGFAFYFKQTTIGIWIAFAVFLIWFRFSRKESPLFGLIILSLGCILLTLVISGIFASQQAFNDFYNQAFLYNFVYIDKHEGIRRLIPVFLKGFLFLSQGAVLYFSILGWLISLFYAWNKRKNILQDVHPIILLALLDLPLEVVLITISGRSILHYYLTPLPVMAILSGILVYCLTSLIRNISFFSFSKRVNISSALILFIVLLFQIDQVLNYRGYIENEVNNSYAPVINYVINNTNPDDKVLILGAESVVNFLSKRESPTRYVYQYPLQLLGSRVMFEEYFSEITNNKPVLIIDAPGSSQLDDNLYKPLQTRSAIVRDGVKYLIRNYKPVQTFGDWVIYQRIEIP